MELLSSLLARRGSMQLRRAERGKNSRNRTPNSHLMGAWRLTGGFVGQRSHYDVNVEWPRSERWANSIKEVFQL